VRVLVYVEGRSDRLAMEALLKPLLEKKRQEGVAIRFIDMNGKGALLTKIPKRAANILLHPPSSIVVALPDLYPPNEAFPHETPEQLTGELARRFEEALQTKSKEVDERVRKRFRVFCFKHDLEALLLAAETALGRRLAARSLKRSWRVPVEDQDHERPPKRVVEELFAQHGQRYQATVDAPLILGSASYATIADLCTQCFRPFVEFLEALVPEAA